MGMNFSANDDFINKFTEKEIKLSRIYGFPLSPGKNFEIASYSPRFALKYDEDLFFRRPEALKGNDFRLDSTPFYYSEDSDEMGHNGNSDNPIKNFRNSPFQENSSDPIHQEFINKIEEKRNSRSFKNYSRQKVDKLEIQWINEMELLKKLFP